MIAGLCDDLILRRQHIGPKHLGQPAPGEAALRALFEAAAAAPDHGQLRPWRFLVLGAAARDTLAQAFAEALRERDPAALPEQLEDARAKAYRGPVLLLAIADLSADDADVPDRERLLSLGCAVQNLLLAARARGFASGLTSGRAMDSQALRRAFSLKPAEHAVCCISLGTPLRQRPLKRRPGVDEFVQWLR